MTAAVLGAVPGTKRTLAARHEVDAAVREPAGADLRSREVGEHADRPADSAAIVADAGEPFEVLVDGAVAEVEADDVDAGPQQRLQRGRRVGRRAERGDDLGPPDHVRCLARRTAPCSERGSVAPRAHHGHVPDASDPTGPLRAFIDASPSPWHAVHTAAGLLGDGGFVAVDETAPLGGGSCPTPATSTRGGALIAWRRPAGAGAAARPPRRRPHRLPRPARQAAPRRRTRRLAPARRRDLRRRAAQQLARPRPRRRRTARARRRQRRARRGRPTRSPGCRSWRSTSTATSTSAASCSTARRT